MNIDSDIDTNGNECQTFLLIQFERISGKYINQWLALY